MAGGYVRVGRAKESLALYKTIPMQDATVGDFQGAIGAPSPPMTAIRPKSGSVRPSSATPQNPAILLAARYEQARGDNQRAAEY